MEEKKKLIWEDIDATLQRLEVPGGWLIEKAGGLTFIPDAEHKWNLDDYDFE